MKRATTILINAISRNAFPYTYATGTYSQQSKISPEI